MPATAWPDLGVRLISCLVGEKLLIGIQIFGRDFDIN